MTTLLAQAKIEGPEIDWAGLSPLIALIGGSVIVLLLGLFRARAGARAPRAVRLPRGDRRRRSA